MSDIPARPNDPDAKREHLQAFLANQEIYLPREPSALEQTLVDCWSLGEDALGRIPEGTVDAAMLAALRSSFRGWHERARGTDDLFVRAFQQLPSPIHIESPAGPTCNRSFSAMLERNRDIQAGLRSALHVNFLNFTERLLASEHIRVAKLHVNCGGTTYHIRTVALPEKGVKIVYYLPSQIGHLPTLAPLELNVHLLGISGLTAKEIAWLLERRLTRIQYLQKSQVPTFDRVRKAVLGGAANE